MNRLTVTESTDIINRCVLKGLGGKRREEKWRKILIQSPVEPLETDFWTLTMPQNRVILSFLVLN